MLFVIFLLLIELSAPQQKSHLFIPRKELCGLSPNVHIHVSVSDFIYSLDQSTYFPLLGIFVSNFRYCVFAVRTRNCNAPDLWNKYSKGDHVFICRSVVHSPISANTAVIHIPPFLLLYSVFSQCGDWQYKALPETESMVRGWSIE